MPCDLWRSENALRRTRTCNPLIKSQRGDSAKADRTGISDDAPANPSSRHSSGDGNPLQDANLRRLIDAWPELPDTIRAGILAMVDAVADG